MDRKILHVDQNCFFASVEMKNNPHLRDSGDIKDTADEIRNRVKNELGLTCSVGASFNKVFAKLGSDYRKPDATTLITRGNFYDIVWPLPVGDLLYAGHSTQKKFARININTIGQLAALPCEYVESYLGKNGAALWIFANGLDESPGRVLCFVWR